MKNSHKIATDQRHWDVVVVGGGPAGLMAAGRAGARGKSVLMIEKNATLGNKLRITGGGRCNVTNAIYDTRTLLARYGEAEPFLYSAFAQWSVKETFEFFQSRGVALKIEAENRVFPTTDKAQTIFDCMHDYVISSGVTVATSLPVQSIDRDGIHTERGIYTAGTYILATGGTSRPETGSTGDAYPWLRSLGHTVSDPQPSLVPVWSDIPWLNKVQGLTLPDIKLSLFLDTDKQYSRRGKLLFAHFGLTGPTILNMSKDIADCLNHGQVSIEIDLFPNQDYGVLNDTLVRGFESNSNKNIGNYISTIIPGALVDIILSGSDIETDTKTHSVTREQRLSLVRNLKHIKIPITGLLGSDKAVVSSGGVDLNEIDFRTMRSRLHPNIAIIGDVLDINRPSGGFSLQLCWTTGFVAGEHA